MRRAFISDLHLGDDDPALTQTFVGFCQSVAQSLDQLWILGDLFDAYIGDDDDAQVLATVAHALMALCEQGVALHFVAGNRDFVLGDAFAERAGLRLETAFTRVQEAPAIAVCHGDELCLDDVAYQQARAQMRNPAWIAAAMRLPLQTRRDMAVAARARSQEHTRAAPMAIMDVRGAEVDRQMQLHHLALLIHGHTHRPGLHQVADGRLRIVLGDWVAGAPSYLLHSEDSLSLYPGRGADAITQGFPCG